MKCKVNERKYYIQKLINCEAVKCFCVFCLPCFMVYLYHETNVMHFSLNLLRIKGLYMFRALFAHPKEVLHKRHSVHCVRMSVGCGTVAVKLQPHHSQDPRVVYNSLTHLTKVHILFQCIALSHTFHILSRC
jgi:hypothetical protein